MIQILLAARELSGNHLAYFSGERFTVDEDEGLDAIPGMRMREQHSVKT